ncbi:MULTISPECIES: ImuA family protein [Asaia]|uniref:ImuA family protein n=1 Tax=Asaia TaxID=91914 RepID=UPI002FC276C6
MKDRPGMAMLRDRVARIEQRYHKPLAALYLKTGLPLVDEALKGGLRRGAIHEFMGEGHDQMLCARPTQFVAKILAQVTGPVIWVMPPDAAPLLAGLQQTGLSAERLLCIEVHPARMAATIEDVLRSQGVAAVVADLSTPLSLTASRRLALAAETSGVTGFLLHRHQQFVPPSACWTRWRVGAVASPPIRMGQRALLSFAENFSLALLRHRGGDALNWRIGTDHVPPSSFSLAAVLAHDALAQGAPAARSGLAAGSVWPGKAGAENRVCQ